MATAAQEKKLKSVLTQVTKISKGLEAPAGDEITQLIFGILWHGETRQFAAKAIQNMTDKTVDLNDLRMSSVSELHGFIEDDSELTREKVLRLKAALLCIFEREHSMSLSPLKEMGKKQVQQYLQSITSLTPDMVAHTMLFGFQAYAIPVDSVVREALIAAGAIDNDVTVQKIESLLCKHIKAANAPEMVLGLRQWAEGAAKADVASTIEPIENAYDPPEASVALQGMIDDVNKPVKAKRTPKKKPAVAEKSVVKKTAAKSTAATKKAPAKKPATKKTTVKKPVAKKTLPAKKAATKTSVAITTATKKTPAKKPAVKKAPVKKPPAKKTSAKTTTKKPAAKKPTTTRSKTTK